MTGNPEKEQDRRELLASIEDREDRERTRREWGLIDEDDEGRRKLQVSHSTGYHSSLNRAILGHDEEAYLSSLIDDPDLVAEIFSERAHEDKKHAHAIQYLSRGDVQAIYDAASTLGQVHGLAFNAFLTISYAALGLQSHEAMTAWLTDFLDEAGDQMKRWGYCWHWAYVHEHSAEHGLHAHVVATVDPAVRYAFEKWVNGSGRSFIARHSKKALENAVDMQIKGPRSEHSAAQWQCDRIQYLVKSLDPKLMDRDATDGKLRPLVDLLGINPRYRNRAGAVIPFKKRVGCSQSLGNDVRNEAKGEGLPLLSAFGDKAWSYLHMDHVEIGWDLKEHKVRLDERTNRQLLKIVCQDDEDFRIHLKRVQAETSVCDMPVDHLIRDAMNAARIERLDRHPYTWDRSWVGWWRTLPRLMKEK